MVVALASAVSSETLRPARTAAILTGGGLKRLQTNELALIRTRTE